MVSGMAQLVGLRRRPAGCEEAQMQRPRLPERSKLEAGTWGGEQATGAGIRTPGEDAVEPNPRRGGDEDEASSGKAETAGAWRFCPTEGGGRGKVG